MKTILNPKIELKSNRSIQEWVRREKELFEGIKRGFCAADVINSNYQQCIYYMSD